MRRKNFYIMSSNLEKVPVRGFLTPIKLGKLKFGVSQSPNSDKWRVTELETGWAVPLSFADTKEESIKRAQKAIDNVNKEQTYIDGVIKGIKAGMAAIKHKYHIS